jgi:hydrogenase-4 component D
MAKTPLLGIGFVVAALAIIGVPPFSGFFSKFAILAGGFEVTPQHMLLLPLLLIAVAESIGAFAWFLKWIGYSVPGEPSEAMAAASPVPLPMRIVLIVLIIMSVCSSVIAASWLG